MICAACGAAPKPTPLTLPLAPGWLAPVPVPALKVGMDARVALARTYTALALANGRLEQGQEWYAGVRAKVAGQADAE
ncbi:MAG: hypothetical protein K0S00_3405 [Xanthobacteraceae bacterium]|jgi:hypothetical protein|nr:hypothetical protein [Xanthobacteraceae bacterium]